LVEKYSTKMETWRGTRYCLRGRGVGANVVHLTAQEGIYAFTFSQQGLMTGMGIQGSKITNIYP
jgi:hypothetical protein